MMEPWQCPQKDGGGQYQKKKKMADWNKLPKDMATASTTESLQSQVSIYLPATSPHPLQS